MKLTRQHYDEICDNNAKNQIEKVINKCYDELYEYEDCYIKYIDISEGELQKNFEVFKSEKCQKYFEDPIKYVPTCAGATTYHSISKLNNMELTRRHTMKFGPKTILLLQRRFQFLLLKVDVVKDMVLVL